MKKKLITLLLCLLFVSVLLQPVAASGLPLVVDEAGLLTQEEIDDLSQYAQSLGSAYGMDIVIVTVNSLNGLSAANYADSFYDLNGYGVGPDYDGILLLLAMESREWYISTCGAARYAVPDREINNLFGSMSSYLSGGDYYRAFLAYLTRVGEYLDAYENGGSSDTAPGFGAKQIFISLGIGLAVGGVTLIVMRSMMNTKRPQRAAADYLDRDTYQLKVQRDMFLYSRVSKVPRPKNNSSGSSGGGGRSHGGGGGRF